MIRLAIFAFPFFVSSAHAGSIGGGPVGGGGVGTGGVGASAVSGRPTNTPIAANCTPTMDATSHRESIQACLDTITNTRLPCGTWEVHERANSQALILANAGQTLKGMKSAGENCTEILLQRVDGFSEARMIGILGSGTEVASLDINGGQGAQTCAEAKYNPEGGGQGQQQHGIFVISQDAAAPIVGFSLAADVVFSGITGDALYLYANVRDIVISNQTIQGFCRSGLTMNTYEGATLSGVTVEDVNFDPSPLAQSSTRGIDVEPNALITNLTLTNVKANRIEVGKAQDVVFDNVTIEERSGIAANGANIDAVNLTIRNSNFANDQAGPVLDFQGSDVLIEDSVFTSTVNANDAEALRFSGRFDRIGPVTIRDTTVTGTGTGWAMLFEVITEPLIVDNVTVTGEYGLTFFGATAITVEDSDFTVTETAINTRDATAITGNRNTGTSTAALAVNNAAPIIWCDNTITGTVPAGATCP